VAPDTEIFCEGEPVRRDDEDRLNEVVKRTTGMESVGLTRFYWGRRWRCAWLRRRW
jgi:hypothetical protein